MKDFMESINDIDWVRNTLWFIFYVVGVIFLFLGWIMPSLDEFRRANIERRKADFLLVEVQKENERLNSALEGFKTENASLLNALLQDNDERVVRELLVGFFEKLRISEMAREKDSFGFEVVRFSIEGNAQNSALIYRFIDEMSKISHIAKVEFPIVLKSENSQLHFSAILKLYRTTPLESLVSIPQ